MQGIEQPRPPGSAMEVMHPPAVTRPVVERPVWKRSHLIGFLFVLSLVPGVVAAAFRSDWSGLPPGVRMTAYIVSGILIVAACALMLQEDPGVPAARRDDTGSSDSP
jgi:hypothetical protein